MPQQKRRPRTFTPKPQPEPAMTHPAVLVIRVPGEAGKDTISVVEMNGFEPMAVPLFLRMAADGKEKSLKGES